MKKIYVFLMTMVILLGLSVTSYATLVLRGTDTLGNHLIYDSDLNITWYDFTRYDTWQNQVNWADALEVTFDGTTYDNWRLPLTDDGPWKLGYDGSTTVGYNITTSEMGYLYYTALGNLGYCDIFGSCPQAGWGLTNTGYFENLQAGTYWSGTEYSGNDSMASYPDDAWLFVLSKGSQATHHKYNLGYALAVRDGDVTTSVPEPATLLLLGFGLAGIVVCKRKLIRRLG